MRLRIVTIGMLLLVCSSMLILAQNGSDLFQQGLAKERAEGDLQGAIKIYERIVKEFPSNRPIVAKALVQLGICYERLGQAKSREYFQQVIAKYGDQADMVAQAKARLNTAAGTSLEIATPYTRDIYSFAISPDGRSLVFVATVDGKVDGKTALWLRHFDSGKQSPIPGTESTRYGSPANGANPFWSPDGRFIGYFEDRKLKRISVGGGIAKALADAPGNLGGTWSSAGVIVFAPNIRGPLYSVPADGGAVVATTRLEPQDLSNRYPQFLPDGRHFLFLGGLGPGLADGVGLLVGSLDSMDTQRLHSQTDAAAFAPPDHLVFEFGHALYVQHLDLQKMELTGPSVRLAERVATFLVNLPGASGVSTSGGLAAFSASAAGIAYRADVSVRKQLIWRDRMGRQTVAFNQTLTDLAGTPQFSPDGRIVALSQSSEALLVDLSNGSLRRLSLGIGMSSGLSPVWSPSGDSFAFTIGIANATGMQSDTYQRATSSALEPRLLVHSPSTPMDWHGNFLLFGNKRGNLLALPLTGGDPIPVVVGPGLGGDGRFSPNGNWIAYVSVESAGQLEIFVQPFPGSIESRRKVSVGGGTAPQWSRNGNELYYLSPDNHLMVVPVTFGTNSDAIETGTPKPLFADPLPDRSTYAPDPNGERFLLSVPAEAAPPIFVLSNWARGNKK